MQLRSPRPLLGSVAPGLVTPWWIEVALAEEVEAEPAPPLQGEAEADVAIVGGGYTGLWTALALHEREPGLRIVVLEADECGFGPSGRNGGFVHGYWGYLPRLRARFGDEGALAGARAAQESCSVHEHTRVTTIRPGLLETPKGRVSAEEIVVAVNAAAAAWPPLARQLTVFGSYVVLTEPAPELLERIGWTGGEAVIDGRMFLHYFRTTPDGRVLMGSGSGPIRIRGRPRRGGPAPPPARAGRGTDPPRLGRADRRLLGPPAVLRHGPGQPDPLRRRLFGQRRRRELARRPDSRAPGARRRRRADPAAARHAARPQAPAGT